MNSRLRSSPLTLAVSAISFLGIELGIAQGPIEHGVEMEPIVVRAFDVDPVEYPALPEVEGTRINSGKKTSFVKPEEFPTIANNNYREVYGDDARPSGQRGAFLAHH